ncbi:hypothetical protein like AT4G24330 [Hibiscus trionum]|uniref:Uncharacterized protein n=1 Tax=Hibiscus trionum TaxID=183268 RepID=A0A9W7MWN6_HIBTR|nr:hypothetical protein like AT4G24330 [Hibiscus trionum]
MNFSLFHLLFLLSLLITHLSFSRVLADSHFEEFDAEDGETIEEEILDHHSIRSPPVTESDSHPLTDLETQTEPDPNHVPASDTPSQSDLQKPSATSFEYWDEDNLRAYPSNSRRPNLQRILKTPLPMTQIRKRPRNPKT